MIIQTTEQSREAAVGGKAAALFNLTDAGFNLPAFFVILPEAFTTSGPNKNLPKLLNSALTKLGTGPFAVRSSGQGEDGGEHSHAGQFDTLLNVAAGDVQEAAYKVWQSGFSSRIRTYSELKSSEEVRPPAIIVQKMINAKVSGVAFSADPVSGLRDHIPISAIEGLGDALVSGKEDGQSWTIKSKSILSAPTDNPILNHEQLLEVANLARRAELHFGRPQDIEWAFDIEGLHILQARPITTPLKLLPNKDTNLIVFDNSNIIESYPGLVSPLTYSFAVHVYSRVYRAFVRLLGVSEKTIEGHSDLFDNLLGRIDGRVFYNLNNWYRALTLLPGFSLNRSYMETMMGVSQPMPEQVIQALAPPPATGFAKVPIYGRLLWIGLQLFLQALRLPRTRRGFYARLNDTLESDLDLASATPRDLVREYRRIEGQLLDRWDAPLINDFLCMIAFGASRSLLNRWLGDVGLQLHNDVMIGQGDIVSAEPVQRIREMGELARDAGLDLRQGGLEKIRSTPPLATAFDSYLEKFSDRCAEELKLESIPLDENPTALIAAIAASAERGDQVPTRNDPDWRQLFARRPLKHWMARRLVGWAKARVRDRENLRFERTRVFGCARRVFMALGRELSARDLIVEPRHIFYLTKDEILDAVEGSSLSADLKALVKIRKDQDEASATRPEPPERLDVSDLEHLNLVTNTSSHTNTDFGDQQIGTGCSVGTVTAVAQVIHDPTNQSLKPGNILVARHTDPGWIAVFSNASAIVVERGSLLSHSAIVARELGIPCVVGLKNATRWIDDGDRIEVNGATGNVRKLNVAK